MQERVNKNPCKTTSVSISTKNKTSDKRHSKISNIQILLLCICFLCFCTEFSMDDKSNQMDLVTYLNVPSEVI